MRHQEEILQRNTYRDVENVNPVLCGYYQKPIIGRPCHFLHRLFLPSQAADKATFPNRCRLARASASQTLAITVVSPHIDGPDNNLLVLASAGEELAVVTKGHHPDFIGVLCQNVRRDRWESSTVAAVVFEQ